jgi:hypothetical protein
LLSALQAIVDVPPSDRNFEVVTSTATTQSLAPAPFYVVVTV